MSSIFENVVAVPADPILKLSAMYKEDTSESKVDLGIGAYRDDSGKPEILPVVRKAERILFEKASRNHEYLPVAGLPDFTSQAANLIFGADSTLIAEKRVYSIQALSGTGSLYLSALFLKKFYNSLNLYLSKPTWANHNQLFAAAGFTVRDYPYWDAETKGLAFDGFINEIRSAPEGSVFLLHACAHNPTGVDPTKEQWKVIADEIRAKKHFPLFDIAYQGFASGDLDNDAYAIRLFASMGFEMVVCQSFAKSMGLYGERTGCLHVVCSEMEYAINCGRNLERISRCVVSNAPRYGAEVASIVLNSPELFSEWKQDLVNMSSRIKQMRKALFDHLVSLNTPGNWDHIINQIGMFSYTGLDKSQVNTLIKKFHIYLVENGRISVAGLNSSNVEYVAKAIHFAVTNPNPSL